MSGHTTPHRLLLLGTLGIFFGLFVTQIMVRTPDHEVRIGNRVAYGYDEPPPPPTPPPPTPPPPTPTPPPPAASSTRAVPRGTAASEFNREGPSSASAAAKSSVASLCGNGLLDKGEECDLGSRINGIKECSKSCTFLTCGDGMISAQAGEECEPRKIEVEYVDPETGEVATETEYLTPACGTYCVPPTCDEETEKCTGGCLWKFQDRCPLKIQILTEDFFSSRAARLRKKSSSASSSVGTTAPSGAQAGDRDTTKSTVLSSLCGNGVVNGGEACDQGQYNNDAIPNACRTNCTIPICGDGVTDALFGETCDQGLENSNFTPNVCRLTCTPPICGDRVIDGNEECDGSVDCSKECKRVSGASAFPCGNGILEDGEECDDGNVVDGDACSAVCTMETRFCGNAILNIGEECDDGNTDDGDGCSSSCRVENLEPRCGNGLVDGGEECDDGTKNADDTPDRCRTSCALPSCGDGVTDREEECDDGNAMEADDCTSQCELPVCGDGIVSHREECDDGNRENDDGCSMLCRRETAQNAMKTDDDDDSTALFVMFFMSSLIGILAGTLAVWKWMGVR